MPTFLNQTTGEILDFVSNDDYQFIKGLEMSITQGTYVKIPTQIYILQDMSKVDEISTYPKPQTYGYQSNNTMTELEITYEV